MIGIILLIASTIYLIIMSTKRVPTSTPRPILKNKKIEMTMSHAMTNHITAELLRQKAEISRNNYPGNETVPIKKVSWSPSVN